ncbi:4'-phosphopantetheinyl transferase superfamily protein [Streptomyces sp. NPDC046685]|uniref:4'-phosphopantetheinyl transferase superfamily protein n=1 Tax=Streptomyces sp. NPDC046685 TaxID=3157202 RepID=UPI0033EA68ED
MDGIGVPSLFPEGERVVRNAGPRRRRECALGRAGLCAAAVAWSPHAPDIGIDLETAEDLPDEMVPLVCAAAELSRLEDPPPGITSAEIIFSAKESTYKILYPPTGRFWGFLEADMTFDSALANFRLELGGASLQGRYRGCRRVCDHHRTGRGGQVIRCSGYDPHLVVEDDGPTASAMN